MADILRSITRVLSNEVDKHRLFNHAVTKISGATGMAQSKLNNIQNAVAAKYNVITKKINDDITLIQNSNMRESSPLPQKVMKWWNWYQQLTGLDTVELAKRQVITAQDKLFQCQDERRHLNREASIINNKLNEVYSELIQTKRDDPKYVQLTIIENRNLQDQARIMSQLNLLEKEEKDHFTLLATAIKEYHDSQTMSAQKYKYLSILASATIAIISLVASMIYNNRRLNSIRTVVSEAQEKTEEKFEVGIAKILQYVGKNNEKQEPLVVTKEINTNTSMNVQNTCIVLGLCIAGMYVLKHLTE